MKNKREFRPYGAAQERLGCFAIVFVMVLIYFLIYYFLTGRLPE